MIDPDIYYEASRGIYKPNADFYTIGFNTHRLKSIISSSVFSPPAKLIQMDAGGSIGKQVSDVVSWGRFVGDVNRIQATRIFYRKQHCICQDCDDPLIKIKWLWGQFRLHNVKNPVVRHIYIERHGIYMMWRFKYIPTRFLGGQQTLKQLSVSDDFEKAFTFDIIAASDIHLAGEDVSDCVRLAHDLNFLYNRVRAALLTAHDEPSPIVRREWKEVPRVVVKAVPISKWNAPVLPP